MTMLEILVVLFVIAVFLSGSIFIMLSYRQMSARTTVATNLRTARLLIEDLIRNSSSIERDFNDLSKHPGFEQIEVGPESFYSPVHSEDTLDIYYIVLKDQRIGREESFYVYKYTNR